MNLDFYRLRAFADMKMISIFPGVSPAYMINLADVSLDNFAFVLDYHWQIKKGLIMRTNLRIDYSRRDLHNDFGKKQLMAFWNTKSALINYNIFSASTIFEFTTSNGRVFDLSLARGERMPTHMENYGFFLYNIMDGYFYTGNPDLKSEKSYQIELGMTKIYSNFSYKLNLYYNLMQDYISGIIQSEEFKMYSNINLTYIWGAGLNTNLSLTKYLGLSLSATYTHGQNKSFNEPLPLIPPLNGRVSLSYQLPDYWFAVGTNFASSQHRIAFRTTMEDRTGSYIDTFIRGRINLSEYLELKFGVENLFDVYYHQHLSINNLPGRGRNIYFGVNAKLVNN